MTTRRERLERKVERRGEWAEKATARSATAFAGVRRIADNIPFGQPILIGHHSEKRARKDVERIRGGMDRGVAEHRLAQHHEQKADGLARQLEQSVFSDDPDAIEQLRAKMARLEAESETMKAANAVWKSKGAAGLVALLGEVQALEVARRSSFSGSGRPFPSYALTNTRAEIRRCKARIVEVERRQARQERAQAAGGVTVDASKSVDWVVVTFEDKPAREVLQALRGAGFHWGQGSWHGLRSKLPAEVLELVGGATDAEAAQ